jgi:phosphotransferase system enzyme I (PtsI)
VRGLRLALLHPDALRTQLRAVLRAAAAGPIGIMFPMVSEVDELRRATAALEEARASLAEEGVEAPPVEVGAMVEVPAAAVMAEELAAEADFLSIGTNDLVQYVLAVDRTNEQVANLYTAAHPAVLVLLKEIVRAGRRAGIDVSVCGEMAGEAEYVMLLIGIGLRSLSVSPAAIPRVKRIVRSVEIEQCERLARRVGSFDSERQVLAFLREQVRTIIPEAFDGRAVEEP